MHIYPECEEDLTEMCLVSHTVNTDLKQANHLAGVSPTTRY